jgi:hypothetical protein
VQTVPTDGQRHGQVEHNLARVVVGANAVDSAPVKPTACSVLSSNRAPACGTTFGPAPSNVGAGYGAVVFLTRKVIRFPR